MKVLYLHGLYSRPGGTKPTFLAGQGFELLNPYLPDEDFVESCRRAQGQLEGGSPEVIVGSSRGGAVALNIATGEVPLVLIAPAWSRWGEAKRVKPSVTILHSAADEVIPLQDSLQLLVNSQLAANAHLQIVGKDHNMTDPAALGALVQAILRWAADVDSGS